jgi:alpha-galactosidase
VGTAWLAPWVAGILTAPSLSPQDPLGQQGIRLTPKGDTEIWARRLANGDTAVALYNKHVTPGPTNITVSFADLGYAGAAKVYDIWAQSVVDIFPANYTAAVNLHGVAFLRISDYSP